MFSPFQPPIDRTPPRPILREKREGFALLVTITLVAFLVLILVSLAAFTRVETQVASNSTQMAQARQSALFGLQIALGELQKHAGADQRVTAPATTVYPSKDVTNATGELFGLYRARAQTAAKDTYLTPAERTLWETDLRTWWNSNNRNPHWTAVLDSSLRRDSATVGKYGEFKRDQLPVWLVSGNERPGMQFDPATATVYPSGYYTPDVDPATLLPPGSDPAKEIVTLVGHKSSAPAADSVDGLDGAVRVVRQPLEGTPPGVSTAQTIGHYAWWVGDESTKANFAIRDPWFTNNSPSSPEYRNRLQVPQRIGWERIEGLRQVFDSGDAPSVNDERFLKVLTREQIPFLHPDFTDPLRQAFHHLTAYSRSLHTDTALGGLKKDLTIFLEGTGSGISTSDPIFDRSLYATDDPRFGNSNTGFPHAGATANLPTWGQLKNWSDTVAISDADAVSVVPGRAPVIANYAVFYGFSRDGDKLRMHWMPQIVLWNPFDTRLESTNYRLKWMHHIGFRYFGVATKGITDPTPAPAAEHNDPVNPDRITNQSAIDTANADGRVIPDTDWFIHRLDGVDWYNPSASNYKGIYSNAGNEFGKAPWDGDAVDHVTPRVARPTYRIAPFNRFSGTPSLGDGGTPAPWDPRATWVTYEFTADFEPGQVKVFTVGTTQQKVASQLHDGSQTVLLENTFEPHFPESYWFELASIAAPVPAAGDETRLYAINYQGRVEQALQLDHAGTGMRLWRHEYPVRGPGGKSIEGGTTGADPSTWRIVPTTAAWDTIDKARPYNDKNNPTAHLYRARLQPFTIQNFVNTSHPNAIRLSASTSFQRAFAVFNLAAPSLDLSTKIEQSRSGWPSHNADRFNSNKFFITARIDAESSDVRNNPWNPGHVDNTTGEGYALLTYLGQDTTSGNKGLSRLPMRQVRRANARLLSLGQFQQANLSLLTWQPGFPLGNSEASPYVDRARIAGIESYSVGTSNGGYLPNSNTAYPGIYRTSTGPLPNAASNEMLDISYLLNEGLWDRTFLSSIPQSGAVSLDNTTPLANSRHRFIGAAASLTNSEARNFDTAAAWLENLGALNVNSTSVEAWKSLFTAFRGLSYASDDRSGTDISEAIPVSRTLDPLPSSSGGGNLRFTFDGMNASDVGASPTGARDYSKFFLGFRHLTDDMIQALAERIVDEVRLRGPFHSVADFVNRRLVSPDRSGSDPWLTARTSNQWPGDPNTTDSSHLFGLTDGYDPLAGLAGINGALQRAINLSGINGGVNYPLSPVSTADRAFRVETDRSKVATGGMSATANRPMQMFPSTGHMLDAEHLAGVPVGEAGSLLSHSPGFVTSADLLAMIGPALTARGDTFLLRTYGDAINPATGETAARAWLEAVVQRTVEPVTPAGSAGAARFQPADAFGRRFVIVSIRWLGADDI